MTYKSTTTETMAKVMKNSLMIEWWVVLPRNNEWECVDSVMKADAKTSVTD